MKVLVVRLSSIGDVIHTIPMVAALIEGGHDVAWAVEPPSAPIVSALPGLGQVFVLPKASAYDWNDRFRIARRLRDFGPDAAIDAQGLWKSAFWTWLSGAPRRIGWDSEYRREGVSSVMLSETPSCAPEDIHVIDQTHALIAPLGISSRGSRRFPIELPEEAKAKAGLIKASASRPLALIAPGGGWENKLYPPALWGEVALGLSGMELSPLILFGPGEEPLADAVVAASSGTARRAPQTSILELAALARVAKVFLAADTGPLHVAGAVGASLVGVFGPTDPARNGPWAKADEVVRRTPPCAPCHKRQCEVHKDTMARISPSSILEAAVRRLAHPSEGSVA